MNSQVSFRWATKKDCRQIAELIEIAGEGVPSFYWALAAKEDQAPIDVGIERASREEANFSYRNAILAEKQDEVVAMLLGYKLPETEEDVDIEEYPEIVRPFVELELLVPGSFYINALGTYPQYRNHGYGSQLLEIAHVLAANAGCVTLSIEVFEQNEGAVRLYKRYGYKIIDRRPVVPHPCHSYNTDIILLTCPVKISGQIDSTQC